jgi:hypothetical protein
MRFLHPFRCGLECCQWVYEVKWRDRENEKVAAAQMLKRSATEASSLVDGYPLVSFCGDPLQISIHTPWQVRKKSDGRKTPPICKKKSFGNTKHSNLETYFCGVGNKTCDFAHEFTKMASAIVVSRPLPALPEGWTADKDFKAVGQLSPATQRSIEPVGPHFLAHARRARHKRTFSEDDRIQAQEAAKKVENDEDSDISEPEDPMVLQRDAKDWKVRGQSSARLSLISSD